MYIEVQSNDREMVAPALEKALKDIKEAGVEEIASDISEIIESEEETYSGVLEIELKTDLEKYIRIAMIYSPTAIHILDGSVFLDKKELLETLGDISNMTRRLMEEFQMMFQVQPTAVKEITDVEEEIPLTLFCEVRGIESKIREQAEFVFADSRARVERMKMRKADEGVSILAIEGYFPDPESIFETTAKMTPIAFAADLEGLELSMRDIQVIGMCLSSLTAEIATKKITMNF
jgi:hypothetical protein